jgi:hypothetical protein
MKNVGFNQVETLEVKDRSVRGIDLCATLNHTTVNTAFVGIPIDWSFVNITVSLKRGGKTFKIYQGPVLPLLIDSAFIEGQIDQVLPLGSTQQVVYVPHSATQVAVLKQTGRINFHGVINLAKTDCLVIEVFPTSTAVLSTVNQTSSVVSFDVIEGVGNEPAIPVMEVQTVKQGEGNCTYGIGNGVVAVTYVNNDKTGISLANQVVQSVLLQSDKLQATLQYENLLIDRYDRFATTAQADARHQSFKIFDVSRSSGYTKTGLEPWLNQVNLTVTFNPANVASGRNWILTRSFVADNLTRDRAIARHSKHLSSNEAQYDQSRMAS